jgi:predicted nucleic acid-binding protein
VEVAAGLVSADRAAQAHADLLDLAIELWPYELLSSRVWELRANLSAYDAGYVAVAELTDAPLVTLDRRIARAPGLRCAVTTP